MGSTCNVWILDFRINLEKLKQIDIMKKFIFIFISILCSVISVSAQQIRKVGDIVVVNGELGVVFAVTTDGQHGKAVSVLETKCNWSNAKNWCTQIGTGWRLPTQEELKVIYENMRTINTSLKYAGILNCFSFEHPSKALSRILVTELGNIIESNSSHL